MLWILQGSLSAFERKQFRKNFQVFTQFHVFGGHDQNNICPVVMPCPASQVVMPCTGKSSRDAMSGKSSHDAMSGKSSRDTRFGKSSPDAMSGKSREHLFLLCSQLTYG